MIIIIIKYIQIEYKQYFSLKIEKFISQNNTQLNNSIIKQFTNLLN